MELIAQGKRSEGERMARKRPMHFFHSRSQTVAAAQAEAEAIKVSFRLGIIRATTVRVNVVSSDDRRCRSCVHRGKR